MIKSILFLSFLISSLSHAGTYLAPTIGVMTTPHSSGEQGAESSTVFGAEGFYIYDYFMGGIKYDHYSGANDSAGILTVKSKFDLLSVQLGARALLSEVSPYFVLGGGVLSQSVTTKLLGTEETFSTSDFAFNLGLGVLVQFSKNWVGDVALRYYPQNFINGINYMLSVGYYF